MDAVPEQARVMLIMAAGGLALGFVFDLYRLLRWQARPRRFATFLGDILFWAVASSVFAAFLVWANYGEIRAGALLGAGLGLLAYMALLSRFVVSILGSALRGIGMAGRTVGGAAVGTLGSAKGAFSVTGLKVRALMRRLRKGKGV